MTEDILNNEMFKLPIEYPTGNKSKGFLLETIKILENYMDLLEHEDVRAG